MSELSERDPAMYATVTASERLRKIDLTSAEFAHLLAQPLDESASSLPSCRAVLQKAVFGYRDSALFSKVMQSYLRAFTPRLVEVCAPLADYRKSTEQLISRFASELLPEANAWATQILANQQALALEFLFTEPGRFHLEAAAQIPLAPAINKEPKNNKALDRTIKKLAGKRLRMLDDSAKAIAAAGCASDPLACLTHATQQIYGHVQPLAHYALVSLYAYFGTYVFFLRAGYLTCELKLLAEIDDITLVHHKGFHQSVVANSKLLATLPTFNRLAERLTHEENRSLSTIILAERQTLLDALEGWHQSLVDIDALKKAHRQEIGALQARLESRGQDAKPKSSAAAPKEAALQTELLNLQARVEALTAALAHRDELLAQRRPAHKPAGPPAPKRIEAKPISASPALSPSLSREDALAKLSGLRGVLVGGHRNFHNKIEPLLPNWSCYDADRSGVEEAIIRNADLVVFQTDYCSHTLTEGVLAKTRQFQIPVVYAYKVNPPAFMIEVCEAFQKISPLGAPRQSGF